MNINVQTLMQGTLTIFALLHTLVFSSLLQSTVTKRTIEFQPEKGSFLFASRNLYRIYAMN